MSLCYLEGSSCCLKLQLRCAASSYCLVASSCYFDLLPCYLFFKLLCYLYLSMPLTTSLPFTFWLPLHLKYLLTPLHLLLHYLVALCFIPLLMCCVGWYFLSPSSFAGRSLKVIKASRPTTREVLSFFFFSFCA